MESWILSARDPLSGAPQRAGIWVSALRIKETMWIFHIVDLIPERVLNKIATLLVESLDLDAPVIGRWFSGHPETLRRGGYPTNLQISGDNGGQARMPLT